MISSASVVIPGLTAASTVSRTKRAVRPAVLIRWISSGVFTHVRARAPKGVPPTAYEVVLDMFRNAPHGAHCTLTHRQTVLEKLGLLGSISTLPKQHF